MGEVMDSVMLITIGYFAWCFIAFFVARFLQIKNSDKGGLSLLIVVMAAPLVIVEVLTGKGTIR